MGETMIATKIRELRKQSGYTQAEVSRKINVQRQTYSNYENATRMPPLEILVALAELYAVSVDYLIRGYQPDKAEIPGRALNNEEEQLIRAFSELTQESRKDVLNYILFKKMYPS